MSSNLLNKTRKPFNNKYGKQLFEIVLRDSVSKSFGRYLSNNISDIIYQHLPDEMNYRYKVPPALCRPSVNKAGSTSSVFSTSGVLAVFDELSTYSLILEDKSYRPGVSVDLFTESLKEVEANSEVLIVTKADKIGKILGFCTMEMRSLDGEILARGKHIKYLPMGWWWDIIISPVVLPVALFFFNFFMKSKLKTPIDHLFNPTLNNTPIKSPPKENMEYGYIFNTLLDLSINTNIDDRQDILERLHDDHHIENELYNIKVKKEMHNPLGVLHGGALGTLIEEACLRYKWNKNEQLKDILRVKSLDIRYLAPMKGELAIKVGEDKFADMIHPNSNADVKTLNKSIGYIYSKKGRHICAEFTCEWHF